MSICPNSKTGFVKSFLLFFIIAYEIETFKFFIFIFYSEMNFTYTSNLDSILAINWQYLAFSQYLVSQINRQLALLFLFWLLILLIAVHHSFFYVTKKELLFVLNYIRIYNQIRWFSLRRYPPICFFAFSNLTKILLEMERALVERQPIAARWLIN